MAIQSTRQFGFLQHVGGNDVSFEKVLTPPFELIAHRFVEEIFKNIPSYNKRSIKDRAFQALSSKLPEIFLKGPDILTDHPEDESISQFRSKMMQEVKDVVCSVLPQDAKEPRSIVQAFLEKSNAFLNMPGVMSEFFKTMDKNSRLLFPRSFLQLFHMQKEQQYELGILFQTNLSDEGKELLKKDLLGPSFTIDHIRKDQQESFMTQLETLCLKFVLNHSSDETILTAKAYMTKDAFEDLMRRKTQVIMQSFKEGQPLSEIVKKMQEQNQRERDRGYQRISQTMPHGTDRSSLVREKLGQKAAADRDQRVVQAFFDKMKVYQDLFADKTEEELQSLATGKQKLPYQQAAEELLAEKAPAVAKKSKNTSKERKKREPQIKGAEQTRSLKVEVSKKEILPETDPVTTSQKKGLDPEDWIKINTEANRYAPFLAQRVIRWGDLTPEKIKNIPGYKNLSDTRALELQARHYLRGVHVLLTNEMLRNLYTFPSCYIDGKGNELMGRGILAGLCHNGKNQWGVVYIGRDEKSKKIYHAFFETESKKGRQSLEDLLRPKIYEHFQRAKEETFNQEEEWRFASSTTFDPLESSLKMTQADASGQEQLSYFFYPIR